ncbi:MAG: 30S ribosomal protein S20 [Acidobacteriota bacterium]|nr:30S ribosomal protein S20 [Acidobacteriota bacterium]
MANHKSALKEHRRNRARRELNRWHRARLRSAVKKLRGAVAEGDAETARGLLTGTLSLLDRTAKHGAIHVNAADRSKSRLTRAVNKLA